MLFSLFLLCRMTQGLSLICKVGETHHILFYFRAEGVAEWGTAVPIARHECGHWLTHPWRWPHSPVVATLCHGALQVLRDTHLPLHSHWLCLKDLCKNPVKPGVETKLQGGSQSPQPQQKRYQQEMKEMAMERKIRNISLPLF